MADFATPNLPSRDFDATEAFYGALGFGRLFRADYWLILTRGDIWLEFFPWPDLDPAQSNFGCCIRLDDLAAMVAQCEAAGVERGERAIPRLTPPRREPSGLTIAYLVDEDGSLLRLIQHPGPPAGR